MHEIRDREKDLYDFFLEIQKEQAEKGHEVFVTRLDPFVTSKSNVQAAFEGTEVVLSAETEGIFGTVQWQWQERQPGSDSWTDCVGGKINQTARHREFAFTAGKGMARCFRATALLGGKELYVSENTVEILFLPDEEVNLGLQAVANGTSVQLSWNPLLKDKLQFTLTMAEVAEGQEGKTVLVSDEITDTDYTVDLLKENTEYQFTLTAVTPGREIFTSATVKTGLEPDASETVYRALLIGEVDFPLDECTRNFGDVKWMRRMLRQARGTGTADPDGGMYRIVEKRTSAKTKSWSPSRTPSAQPMIMMFPFSSSLPTGISKIRATKREASLPLKKTAKAGRKPEISI